MPLDWTYDMKREMQEIIPGLFLGPYSCASKSKLSSLKEVGITHMICIRKGNEASFVKPYFSDHFIYLTLEMEDSIKENIIPCIMKSNQFIGNCLSSGGKCFIHSFYGMSRSPTIVIGYIMSHLGYSLEDAHAWVRYKRACTHVNWSFKQQLMEYEIICRAQRGVLQSGSAPLAERLKRKIDVEMPQFVLEQPTKRLCSENQADLIN